MFCPNCSFENQTGSVFCASCGAKIEQQQNSWQPPPSFNNQAFPSMPTIPTPEITAAEAKSVTSLVLGIISVVTGFFIVGIILGPIALSKGKKARRVLDDRNNNFYIALAGVITGTIGLVLSIIGAIFWIVFISRIVAGLSMFI